MSLIENHKNYGKSKSSSQNITMKLTLHISPKPLIGGPLRANKDQMVGRT